MSYSQKLALYDMTCEHRVNPIGIETQKPRFSWKIKTSQRNMIQNAYSISVSETASFSESVWESGEISSSESNLVSYNGPTLESTKRYYWQVKIWDNKKNKSIWSIPAYWEMRMSFLKSVQAIMNLT